LGHRVDMVVNKTTLLRLLSSSKGGLWCQCHKETEFRQQKLVLLHPFNGHFSRKTWVSRYQNGKTSPDLNETRDDGVMGWQRHHLGHMQTTYTSLQTDNHTNTSSLEFLQAGCSSCRPTNSVRALKAINKKKTEDKSNQSTDRCSVVLLS